MKGLPETTAKPTFTGHYPTGNTAAVVTLAAAAGLKHVVDWVGWSYDTTPTGGSLTIAINSVTKYQITVPAAGHGFIEFPGGIYGDDNQAVVITLAAGGGSVVGKVNVRYR